MFKNLIKILCWLIYLAFIIREERSTLHMTTKNLRHLLKHRIVSSIYLIDHILYQIFKINLTKFLKKHANTSDNPPIQTYASKTKDNDILKINTGCKLKLFLKETVILLEGTEQDTDKDKNGENTPIITGKRSIDTF